MHNYRQLEVWQIGMKLTKDVYQFSDKLPPAHRFSFISQIQRSSASIPSNIAEGCGRDSNKSLSYFIQIALGSAFELETQLLLCKDIFSVDKQEANNLIDLVQKCQKMLIGLKRSIS